MTMNRSPHFTHEGRGLRLSVTDKIPDQAKQKVHDLEAKQDLRKPQDQHPGAQHTEEFEAKVLKFRERLVCARRIGVVSEDSS
jgi:hypothetical protein